MKLLLDTHVWIWSLVDPGKLSKSVTDLLRDQATELWLSPVSTWEFLMLIERGRIAVDAPAVDFVSDALSAAAFREASLNHEVALESRRLTLENADPADRFLIATARIYDLTLLTANRSLLRAKPCAVRAAN